MLVIFAVGFASGFFLGWNGIIIEGRAILHEYCDANPADCGKQCALEMCCFDDKGYGIGDINEEV